MPWAANCWRYGVVELVSMPMALGDRLRGRNMPRAWLPGSSLAGCAPSRIVPPLSMTFRCSSSRQITGMRRIFVEFRRMCRAARSDHTAAELDRGALHAQTNAQERHAPLAGEANRLDLALDASFAESARHQHARRIRLNSRSGPSRSISSLCIAADPHLRACDGCRHGPAIRRSTCRHRNAPRTCRRRRC